MKKTPKEQKCFLITGGSFSAKGPMSMLFIVVDELRTRFPGCEIYADVYAKAPDGLKFSCVNLLPWVWKGVADPFYAVLSLLRRIIRGLLTDLPPATSVREAKKIFASLDAVIDISGFALSSQFENATSEFYLDRIEAAKKLDIPVFLLPQSFGPFDYEKDADRIQRRIGELMHFPKIIFAREKQGYKLLTEEYGLKNVRLMPDIVLQNRGIDYSHIYTDPAEETDGFKPAGDKKVAIIPNRNMYRIGKKETFLSCYDSVIRQLKEDGFSVYLTAFVKQDAVVLDDIMERHADGSLIRVSENMSIRAFASFIRQFDFVICSRYHGIVHTIKEGVPVISLGWAVKYAELMELFDEQKYVLDIRSDADMQNVPKVLEEMETHYAAEHAKIAGRLAEYQNGSCFDMVAELL